MKGFVVAFFYLPVKGNGFDIMDVKLVMNRLLYLAIYSTTAAINSFALFTY